MFIPSSRKGQTYSSELEWDIPYGVGRLEMEAERDVESRSIQSFASFVLGSGNHTSRYATKVDLDNRSTDDKVDLDLSIELTSNQEKWE